MGYQKIKHTKYTLSAVCGQYRVLTTLLCRCALALSQNKNLAAEKRNKKCSPYLENDVTFVDCFHICEAKSTSEDTAVQNCLVRIFHSLSICPTQKSCILFALTNKARKSGFTQVALNSMLEESAI